MELNKNIVYLYSEVMPYAITIMRALRDYFNVNIHCICWDEDKMTPFIPKDLERVKFYRRSNFDKRGLIEFIESKNPEIVFISGRMDKVYLKAAVYFKSKGIPIVSACDNQWYGTVKNRIAALFSRFIYHRYFDYFWIPGRRQFEFAKRVGFDNKYILNYSLCADVDCFRKAYFERKEKTVGNYPHKIVFAGRFVKNKGIDILIQAFNEFKAEVETDWKLVVVGTGSLKINSTPDIEVKEYMTTEELAAHSASWGVFCLPSIWEPWGVVVHEFTAAGMPVIASNEVGAADTFVIDNYNGFVFKSGDIKSLKAAFKKLSLKSDEQLWMMSERSAEIAHAITPAKSAHSFMSVLRKS